MESRKTIGIPGLMMTIMMMTIITIITRPTTRGKNGTIPVPTPITTCPIVSPEETWLSPHSALPPKPEVTENTW